MTLGKSNEHGIFAIERPVPPKPFKRNNTSAGTKDGQITQGKEGEAGKGQAAALADEYDNEQQ
eukprot:8582357-Prorocentrum_lima.AAC.1